MKQQKSVLKAKAVNARFSRLRIGNLMTFAEILFVHHVVFGEGGRLNNLMCTYKLYASTHTHRAPTASDCAIFTSLVVHHVILFASIRLLYFKLQNDLLHLHVHRHHSFHVPHFSLGRARHYTHILLRHLSNVSTCHLFSFCAFFLLFILYCIRFLGSFFILLPEKQSRYVCALAFGHANPIHSKLSALRMGSPWMRQTRTTSFTVDDKEHIQTPPSATHSSSSIWIVSRLTKFTSCALSTHCHSLRQFIGLRDAFAWITWMNKKLR